MNCMSLNIIVFHFRIAGLDYSAVALIARDPSLVKKTVTWASLVIFVVQDGCLGFISLPKTNVYFRQPAWAHGLFSTGNSVTCFLPGCVIGIEKFNLQNILWISTYWVSLASLYWTYLERHEAPVEIAVLCVCVCVYYCYYYYYAASVIVILLGFLSGHPLMFLFSPARFRRQDAICPGPHSTGPGISSWLYLSCISFFCGRIIFCTEVQYRSYPGKPCSILVKSTVFPLFFIHHQFYAFTIPVCRIGDYRLP